MSRPRSVVWLNGRIVPASRARISVFDRGLLYGDAVFETVRVYAGRPFRWDAHQRRLARTLKRLSIELPGIDLRQAIDDLCRAARADEAHGPRPPLPQCPQPARATAGRS